MSIKCLLRWRPKGWFTRIDTGGTPSQCRSWVSSFAGKCRNRTRSAAARPLCGRSETEAADDLRVDLFVKLEYLRSFGLFGLWQLWQSSGLKTSYPSAAVHGILGLRYRVLVVPWRRSCIKSASSGLRVPDRLCRHRRDLPHVPAAYVFWKRVYNGGTTI